ncbi:hypothetical protein [Companilactobacillus jidongensis]|uniref:hypothetical protein n=1 Tax=Companilactobacillus jidongensis TaxID=2486006 RepID=UPI000F7A0442|nr:hypothetical protein [Companilactobacillus jidongensis]
MLGKRRIIALLVFSVSFLVGLFFVRTTSVEAYYSDEESMAVAPSGIDLKDLDSDDALFVRGKYVGFMPTAMKDRNDPSIYPILRMSDNGTTGVTSSLWSNNDNDNYLDITQKQTLSFWIYFGDSYSYPQGTAFVLQNSGADAIAVGKSGSIAGGQSMGVWGSDTPNKSSLSAIASSAIQKSWALEFDTQSNQNGYKYDEVSKATIGNSFDTYQIIENNSVSYGYQHLAWNYPGRTDSYNHIDTTSSRYTYQMRHKDSEQIYFSSLATPIDSWHHMLIEYNPPAQKGGIARLKYSINLKGVDSGIRNPDTPTATGQKPYSNTIDLDTSEFQLGDSNKLRYGFTSAAGDKDPATEALVFETIPAIVQAEPSAYVVDDTTKSRIGASTPAFDGDDEKLAVTTKVHPKDDLTFKYLLNYQSGKKSAEGIVAAIDLPENVTFGSSDTDVIGKATYTSADGSTTKEIALTTADISNGKLTYDLLTLDNKNSTDWTSVKLELNATANELSTGSTKLTVPTSHIKFEGPNYISDVQTDKFDIVEPADELTISTTKDKFNIKVGSDAKLTGDMKFKNKTDIDNNDMDIHYSIDGGKDQLGFDTGTPNGSFKIPIESSYLDVGTHEVVVQVIDDNYQTSSGVETIASNKLKFTIVVTNVDLIIEPDEQTRTVNDNGIQTISGKLHLSDNSELVEFNKMNTGYSLTDGTGNTQDWIGLPASGNSQFEYEFTNDEHTEMKYTFPIKPIGLSSKSNIGLTVGENDLVVNLGIQSKTDTGVMANVGNTNYKISVPDIDMVLDNTGQEEITTLRGQEFYLPSKFNYKNNPTYGYDLARMWKVMTVDGLNRSQTLSGPTTWVTGEHEVNDEISFNIFPGFDNDKEYFDASYYVTDPYLRKSNTVNYSVRRIQNYTQLSVADDYQFNEHVVDPQIEKLVGRKGNWGISVYSYNSPWVLTGTASKMVRSTVNGGEATVLDGDVVFVDPDDKSDIKNMNINSDGDPVVIDEQTTSTTGTKNVSDEWSNEDGILLDLNSAVNGGSYGGTISWNLTNSV